MSGKRPFLQYMHYFRAIAILFVVLGHVNSSLVWNEESISGRVIQVLLNNATVLFVFIAGFLFQYLSNRYSYKEYLKKKLLYVIIPYTICTIPAIIMRIYTKPPQHIVGKWSNFAEFSDVVQSCIYYLLGAALRPHWFIPMIFIFYIISPILIKGDRNDWLYKLLPIFMITSLIIPRGSLLDIHIMFIHFFSVYVFGMFVSKNIHLLSEGLKKWWYIPFAIFISTSLYLVFYDTFYAQSMFIQKLSIILLLIPFLQKSENKIPKKFGYLADISFGLFFLHDYFDVAYKFAKQKFTGDPFISGNLFHFATISILILFSTILLVYIVKKISKKASRYIVGC